MKHSPYSSERFKNIYPCESAKTSTRLNDLETASGRRMKRVELSNSRTKQEKKYGVIYSILALHIASIIE